MIEGFVCFSNSFLQIFRSAAAHKGIMIVDVKAAPRRWLFNKLVLCSLRLLRLPISRFRQGYSVGSIGILAMTSCCIMCIVIAIPQSGSGNPKLPFEI